MKNKILTIENHHISHHPSVTIPLTRRKHQKFTVLASSFSSKDWCFEVWRIHFEERFKGRRLKLEVKVLSWTSNPEITCVAAMKSTRTRESAYELSQREWVMKCGEKWYVDNCQRPDWTKCPHWEFCIVRYLDLARKNHHWGVFEHATYTVSVSGVSRALTHQLVRHRLASYMQQSQRAVEIDTSRNDWYVIPPLMQGAKESIFRSTMRSIATTYKWLLEQGIPEEDARFVLPNACKTNIVITMNARNWLHFFRLRLDPKAQWEIREMAQKILKELNEISPEIFKGAGELEV